MKCYFYKCDKNYLLLEKGHFKQVHKSWSHQLVMFLYSKFTFSPGQWPLWTAVSPLSGLISMAWHGTVSLADHVFYCRGGCKSTPLSELHTTQVVAVGWELKNSSPTACVWRWDL